MFQISELISTVQTLQANFHTEVRNTSQSEIAQIMQICDNLSQAVLDAARGTVIDVGKGSALDSLNQSFLDLHPSYRGIASKSLFQNKEKALQNSRLTVDVLFNRLKVFYIICGRYIKNGVLDVQKTKKALERKGIGIVQ